MILLAAFVIFAALGSFTLGPFTDWDYFEYEPLSADELAEETAFFEQDVDADAEFLEEGEAWVRPEGRWL